MAVYFWATGGLLILYRYPQPKEPSTTATILPHEETTNINTPNSIDIDEEEPTIQNQNAELA
jgi:hypothetical protein